MKEQGDVQEPIAAQTTAMLQRLRVSAVIHALLIFLGVFVIQLIASMACMLILAFVVMGIRGGSRAQLAEISVRYANDYSMIICLVYAMVTILWCGRMYLRCAWRVRPFPYAKALRADRIVAAIALGFGTCILLTVLLSIAAQIFPGAFERYEKVMEQLDVGNSIFSLPYIALIGPVAEEFTFRGVITDRLTPAFPFWVTNVMQAALFGVFHMNVIQGLYAFLLGVLLGWIVHATGTVLTSMITHIAFNGTTVLMMYLPGEGSTMYGYIESVLLIAAIGCFLAGLKYYDGCAKQNVQE